MIYVDSRWVGSHGIGRFAQRILNGHEFAPLEVSGRPSSALDALVLTTAIRDLPPRSVFFSPGYNAPLFSKIPFVFTIHDLNHVDRPENSSFLKRTYYRLVLQRACHEAFCVLTVSDFSRQRIVEWAGVAPEKVVNVGNGVDPAFRPNLAPYATTHPYLLCVSNRKRHKNDIRTVKAFARAKIPFAIHLVFTGSATPDLESCIRKAGITPRVEFWGHIAESDLPSLYTGATALVFPSLYEGFGLPVLESMACGTPVITSNTSALPEVAGGAAVLVDPESIDAIARAIERVVHDSELRATLREKGLTQAASFSWEQTTRKVWDVLGRLQKGE